MKNTRMNRHISSSFRDPDGFVFSQGGAIYRQVNITYRENYDYFVNAGLYKSLVDSGLLIRHEEVELNHLKTANAYKIIRPEQVKFISYPYEWCFSQLKDAALTTLKIQKRALEFKMVLKDASAYNIQFKKGRPVLIDSLSFEKYHQEKPWVAYRQFCQHFLVPLALMSHVDIRLNQLLRVYIDGIPLDLAAKLLPSRIIFIPYLFLHIYLHAKIQKYFTDRRPDRYKLKRKMDYRSMLNLIESLESVIKMLKVRSLSTEWSSYYQNTNYSSGALEHKKNIVASLLNKTNPNLVWDFGANAGLFSRIASEKGIPTISFDIDPIAVEKNYLDSVKKKEENILPLLFDLTNPSPNIGWQNQERISIRERGSSDTLLALALIHHLAISNNLSFIDIADFFDKVCDFLIIEFVPKSDSQVQRLLSTREDIFYDYTQQIFEEEFSKYFIIQDAIKIRDSERTLYLMKKKQI